MLAIFLNVVLLIAFVAGLVAPFIGAKILRKRRDILQTPVRPVDALDSGWTAVEGRAVPLVSMVAPFAGRPCVYCESRIEVLTGAGQGRGSIPMWETHAERTTKAPFYVEDATGRVLVSTLDEDAHLDAPECFDLKTANESTGVIDTETPVHILESLEALGVPYVDETNQMLPLRYVESYIEAGSGVYVLGRHSADAADVARALGTGADHFGSTIGSVITREREGKPAYVAPGDRTVVPKRLLKQAIACIVLGPLVSAAVAGFLYVVYFVVD